jgi:hypothetical protein
MVMTVWPHVIRFTDKTGRGYLATVAQDGGVMVRAQDDGTVTPRLRLGMEVQAGLWYDSIRNLLV